ncbi:MAG: cyclic nucleotide-binding domain-containing protein [Nitrospinota bacterium]
MTQPGTPSMPIPGPVLEMVRWLQATTLFRGMADQEALLLLRQCGRMKVETFEVICAENEPGDALFYILDGQVYLTRLIGEEEEFLGMLGKGNSFGEAGLLGEEARTATVRARQPSLLLTLQPTLLHLLPNELALKLMRNIAMTGGEKLKMANRIIDRLYEELRSLRPKTQDWREDEDRFIEKFEGNSPI